MDRLTPHLTLREQQVLTGIVNGWTDKEIAHDLSVTHHTVNAFRKILLKKLQARNVASLVRIAILDGHVKL